MRQRFLLGASAAAALMLGLSLSTPVFAATLNTDDAIGIDSGSSTSFKVTEVEKTFLEGQASMMTSADLGVDHVGMLPSSRFYFLKRWGRGITRLFAVGTAAKVELELKINNQTAAEVIEVEKALFPNGVGVTGANDLTTFKKALKNYTDAQARLNARLADLGAASAKAELNGNLQIADLTKKVDEQTGKHVALLEQIAQVIGRFDDTDIVHAIDVVIKDAQNNLLKTFTITVTAVNDAPSLKQKATDEITRAKQAIAQAEMTLGRTLVIYSDNHGEFMLAYDSCASNALGGGKHCKPGDKVGAVIVDDRGVGFTKQGVDGGPADRWVMPDGWALRSDGPADPADGSGARGVTSGGPTPFIELSEPVPVGQLTVGNVNAGDEGGPPSLAGEPIPGIDVKLGQTGGGIAITTSTGSDGSYEFTGLTPGTYDLSIAGERIKSIIVGTEGGVWRGYVITFGGSVSGTIFVRGAQPVIVSNIILNTALINGGDLLITVTSTDGLVVGGIIRIDNEQMKITGLTKTSITVDVRGSGFIKESIVKENVYYLGTSNGRVTGLAADPSDTVGNTYYVGTANGGVWKSLYTAIANAKGDLAGAKEALAEGKDGEAYGLARFAEVMVAGVRVAVGDVDGDGRDDITEPTVAPTGTEVWLDVDRVAPAAPPTVAPKPSPKIQENESPTPEKTETPLPPPPPVIEPTTPAPTETPPPPPTEPEPTTPAPTETPPPPPTEPEPEPETPPPAGDAMGAGTPPPEENPMAP